MENPTISSAETSTVTLPLQALLDYLLIVGVVRKDREPIPNWLGALLASHDAHDKLYHVEDNIILWRLTDWNKYVECGCNLTAYWDYKHGEAAKLLALQQQQAFAQLTPKQKLKLRIAEELAKGNYIGVAMMERTLKHL